MTKIIIKTSCLHFLREILIYFFIDVVVQTKIWIGIVLRVILKFISKLNIVSGIVKSSRDLIFVTKTHFRIRNSYWIVFIITLYFINLFLLRVKILIWRLLIWMLIFILLYSFKDGPLFGMSFVKILLFWIRMIISVRILRCV